MLRFAPLSPFALLLVWFSLMALPAGAQTLEELLPPGLAFDEAGQLQWTAFEVQDCEACEGTGRAACPRCEREARDCGTCDDGKVRCRDCAGTGRTLDPFVEVLCAECEGSGSLSCSACSGAGVRTGKTGVATICSACAGSGRFACPLCDGAGRLASLRTLGGDLRQGTLEELETLDRTLGELTVAWATPRGVQRTADERLETLTERLPRTCALLPLPEGQLERLMRVVETYRETGDSAKGAELVVYFYESAVRSYIHVQLQLLQRCTWRLRKNAGAFEGTGSQKRASELQWFGAMGADPEQPSVAYSLMGQGFLRAPSAGNLEAVIADWLASHPDAVLRVVARLENFIGSDPEADFLYVWAVDGDENLNLHLVELGIVPAGTMQASRPEIEVPFEEYLQFLRAVRKAGEVAEREGRGIFGTPEVKEKDHEEAAERLMNEGKYAEALVELLAANELGGKSAYRWLDIAKCHEELGQWEPALAAYDQAIGNGHWWPPYKLKAHCLRRSESLEVAVAWLEQLAAGEPEAYRFPHILGSFLLESGEPHRAIDALERAVELASAEQHLVFDDEGWLVPDEEPHDYSVLWPTLELLARAYLADGRPEVARIRATMGISIGRELKRSKGYYDETEIEAGDVDCRLLRARVELLHHEWDDAELDLRLARVLASRSGNKPWLEETARLEARLEAERD